MTTDTELGDLVGELADQQRAFFADLANRDPRTEYAAMMGAVLDSLPAEPQPGETMADHLDADLLAAFMPTARKLNARQQSGRKHQ